VLGRADERAFRSIRLLGCHYARMQDVRIYLRAACGVPVADGIPGDQTEE